MSIDVNAIGDEVFNQPLSCQPVEESLTFEVLAVELPSPVIPNLVIEEDAWSREYRTLESVVCCDGSYPHLGSPQQGILCPGAGLELQYDSQCVALYEERWLGLTVALDVDGLPPEIAGNMTFRLLHGDEVRVPEGSVHAVATTLNEAGCVVIEVLDLARGQVSSVESCHGAGMEDEFGLIEVDPGPALAEMCETKPYVCSIDQLRWDSEDCWSWPERASEGCSCRTQDDGERRVGFNGALLLLLLARRRMR